MRRLTKRHKSRGTGSVTTVGAGAFRPHLLMVFEVRNMSAPNKTIFILLGARYQLPGLAYSGFNPATIEKQNCLDSQKAKQPRRERCRHNLRGFSTIFT